MKLESIVIFGIIGIIVLITALFFIENFSYIFKPQTTRDIQLSEVIPENKKTEIFEMMSSPELYPKILPKNVLEVVIINKTDSVIFVNETISEQGFTTQIFVKHEIFPPDQHTIEILDGDAKGTKINIHFVTDDSFTKVISEIHLKVSGPFAYIIQLMQPWNFDSAYKTVIDAFVQYASP